MNHRYCVRPYGGERYGNCAGWQVVDTVAAREQFGDRVVAEFVGDIHHPAKREAARQSAYALCDLYNKEAH
jgi:hypothetical protein